MSLGGEHTHHHGLLAGVSAGGMAVLVFGGGLLLLVWHRIAGAVGEAITVAVWAVAALVVSAAAYGMVFLFLKLRMHARHPETLTRRPVHADVVRVPRLGEVSHTQIPRPVMPELEAGARQYDWPYRDASRDEVQR